MANKNNAVFKEAIKPTNGRGPNFHHFKDIGLIWLLYKYDPIG